MADGLARRDGGPSGDLSDREREVVRLLVEGKTYAEIADDMEVRYETIHTHLKRIRKKLGLRNRTAIAVWAVRNGEV